VDEHVVKRLLRLKGPHEEDYRVFRYFNDLEETIFDVGANYGYSVASFWSVGARAAIVSFEPIAPFKKILGALASRANSQNILTNIFSRRRTSRIEFFITGV